MKKVSILLLILAFFAPLATIDAQQRGSKEDRERWFKEMREYKHNFLIKKLDLTPEQQPEFFAIYDAMESETHKIHHETRKLQRELKKKGDAANDIEYEKAAEALFELKSKQGEIELKYFDQFKKVLSKKQLFMLKDVEDKFTRHIMKQQNRHKASKEKQNRKKENKDND